MAVAEVEVLAGAGVGGDVDGTVEDVDGAEEVGDIG